MSNVIWSKAQSSCSSEILRYLVFTYDEKDFKRIEGERRHVTIIFVDMKGFTPLTETLGPEETFSLIDRANLTSPIHV